MPTKIITKNGSGEPSADKLTAGELAVDLSNKRLYTKDNSGNILELGTNPGPDFPFPDQNGLTISDEAPLDPNEGDQWLNSDTAEVFIYDGAVWLEFPQGRDGEAGADGADGNIADGTQDGIVATWNDTAKQWTPDSSLTIDASGNVGIGTDSPEGDFHVEKVGECKTRIRGTGGSGYPNIIFQTDSRTWQMGSSETAQNFWLRDATRNEEVLNVNNTGDAKFSGTVAAAGSAGQLFKSGRMLLLRDTANYITAPSATGEINFQIGGESTDKTVVRLQANGDAAFSGTVKSPIFSGDQGQGFGLVRDNAITPQKNGGSVNNTLNLGEASFQWKQVFAVTTRSKRVIQDGSPVIDAKGLISTLTTLRNATKDETTLEGLRDALADAIGGLIEDFEHQIATMPAPEPEVSTMPAGDES